MSRPLRVLIVEDSETDCQLIVRELRRGGFDPVYRRVDAAGDFTTALEEGGWDIVLSDYDLPGYSGSAAIRALRDTGSDTPCIIVSGAIGEDAAVGAIRDGADDYLMKDRLTRLPLSVEQHLAEAEARRERRRMEEEIRRNNAELAAQQAIAVAVSRPLDLRKVLQAALEETIRVLGADGGAVLLAEQETEEPQCIVQKEFASPACETIAEMMDEGTLAPTAAEAQLMTLEGRLPSSGARLAALGWSGLVAVALKSRQGGNGILVVGSRRTGALDRVVLSLAARIGSQISVAVENARLHEQVQARTRYLETLQIINERLRSTLPLQKVLNAVAEGAVRVAGGVAAVIVVPDASNELLVQGALFGPQLGRTALRFMSLATNRFYFHIDGDHIAARAYREGKLHEWRGPIRQLTVGLEPSVPKAILPMIDAASGTRSGVCVPLLALDKTVGVLVFFSPREAISDSERTMLLGLADQGGLAMESARLFEETQRLRAFNESIVQGVAEAIFIRDHRGELTFMNPAAEALLGSTVEHLKGRRCDFLSAAPEPASIQSAPPSPPGVMRYEAELRNRQGEAIPVIVSASPLQLEGRSVGVLSACTDISERVHTERLLRALNKAALAMTQALTHEAMFAAVALEFGALGCPSILLLYDAERRTLRVAYLSYDGETLESFRRVTGRRADEIVIPLERVAEEWRRLELGETIVVTDGAEMIETAVSGIDAGPARELAQALGLNNCIAAPLVSDTGIIGVLVVASASLHGRDVPAISALANQIAAAWHKNDLLLELRGNLQELKKVQGQLVHAQKMEALGRLAGGVAHDFNNQLTVIMGNAEMLFEKSGQDERLREEFEEILNTAQRSAQLTQQLLAFSRRQVSRPVNLEPRPLLGNMERMLRRLIGEDIELVFDLAPDTGWIYADPGQVEQVMMNLVVNARDAMPHGGKLVIATSNAAFDRATMLRQAEIGPGRYVVLEVRDRGTGMAPEAMEHLFEPFFTTKPAGVGTGLGLAIVYGIVQQSGGVVTVDSETGTGTTFAIYLPRIEPPVAAAARRERGSAPRGNGELILLVEDELPLNSLIRLSLADGGYRVLSAASSDEAIAIAERGGEPPALLLTDVFMPGTVSRKRMIECIDERWPGIKVVLMSGYADEVVMGQGVLTPGRRLLTKPFTMTRLLEQVGDALADR